MATMVVMAVPAMQAVAAGAIPIDGVFGNEEGCRVYKTGRPIGEYLILTGDTFSSSTIGCAFLSLAAIDHGFTANAVCSPGGSQTVHVIDHGPAGFGFAVGEGAEFGPLAACTGAAITGSLPRMQS